MSNNQVGWAGSAATFVFAGLSLTSVDVIISVLLGVLGMISAVVSLAYTIRKWYKEAKKDGKITLDELKDGAKQALDEVADIVDKVEDIVEDIKDGDKNK